MNPKLHVLAGLHAATWAQLGTLKSEAEWSQGPVLVSRLRDIEAEALPLPVLTFADLAAKARIAETYAEADEAPAEVVAALVAGIAALQQAAPVADGRAQL
jgi:hypothetical protein